MDLQQKYDKHALITQILEVACQLKYDNKYSKGQAAEDLDKIADYIDKN
jgi:hypothetical protein